MTDADQLVTEMETLGEKLAEAKQAVSRRFIGQERVVDLVLSALLCGGHGLLIGLPGLGKTRLVDALGTVMGLHDNRIQFTPDLMPADILGSEILETGADGARAFKFLEGPIFCQLLMADEINRASPRTQAALLQAMQEREVTIAGQHRPLGKPFHVLATQNPIEQEGTYPLPEAQLDRFMFKMTVPFPGREVLMRIGDETTRTRQAAPEQVLTKEQLLDIQAVVAELHTPEPAFDYAARLVLATHPDRPEAPDLVQRTVRFGASPRAMQALVRAGRARALLEGRKHVATEDIRVVAPLVLTHRVVLGFEAQLDRVGAADVVAAVLQQHRS